MAEIATLARPYAEAVFRLADAGGTLAAWSGTLRALAQVAAHAASVPPASARRNTASA